MTGEIPGGCRPNGSTTDASKGSVDRLDRSSGHIRRPVVAVLAIAYPLFGRRIDLEFYEDIGNKV
jgi:hypothetical protein